MRQPDFTAIANRSNAMHNTDRTQQYFETAGYGQELAGTPYAQSEAAFESNDEFEGEYLGETGYSAELINAETGEINPEAEMSLAAELLSVNSEQELNQFLGGFIRRAGRGFKRFANSNFGRTLGGVLKQAAKVALPLAGKALGTLIPIPGVGTAVGGMVGQAAANALGEELEGLSQEDRQFEVARRLVRFGLEGARAMDELPEGEYMTEQEIGGLLKSVAGRVLPSLGSFVRGSLGGAAAGALQGAGGVSGGLSVRSPGGWDVQFGGQAAGQVNAAGAASAQAQFSQNPPMGRPGPRPGAGGPRSGGHQQPITASGRWVRRGRNVIVLNVY
jgi:hypothetical protein